MWLKWVGLLQHCCHYCVHHCVVGLRRDAPRRFDCHFNFRHSLLDYDEQCFLVIISIAFFYTVWTICGPLFREMHCRMSQCD